MTEEREPRFHLHTIDRAAQEGTDRFNREYHLHVRGLGSFSAQVLFPSGHFALSASASLDSEDTLRAQASVPPFGLHLGFESWKVARLATRLLKAAGVHPPAFQSYETSLRVFDWAVWWKVFGKAHEWSARTPPWRDGAWHPCGHPGARLGEEETLEEREDVIQLPEGPQRCTVTLTRARYRSSHFPLLHVTRSFVSFDFHPPVDTGGQKGPIWGMAVEADSIEDGIYKMRQRILAERVRNGYENAPARVAS